MTGITNITEELAAKRVEILKEAFPSLTRLALLANLRNPEQPHYARVIEDAARALQIETRIYTVETQPELAGAFAAMERDRVQAVLMLPDVGSTRTGRKSSPWPRLIAFQRCTATRRSPSKAACSSSALTWRT